VVRPRFLGAGLGSKPIPETLAVVSGMNDESHQWMVFYALAPMLTDEYALQGVELLLAKTPEWKRPDAFRTIASFLPALFQLEGEAGMAEIYRAVRDVAHWFP
jgi:hypothetical protein